MTAERHDLRLCFLTDRSEVLSLNIPHADPMVEGPEVSAAMLAIVNTDAVQSPRGRPLFKYNAALTTTESRDFNIHN